MVNCAMAFCRPNARIALTSGSYIDHQIDQFDQMSGQTKGQAGRVMPNFLIFVLSVLRAMPNAAAVRVMFQPHLTSIS